MFKIKSRVNPNSYFCYKNDMWRWTVINPTPITCIYKALDALTKYEKKIRDIEIYDGDKLIAFYKGEKLTKCII